MLLRPSAQVNDLYRAGADVVRIAVDKSQRCRALAEIRKQTKLICRSDLQEKLSHG